MLSWVQFQERGELQHAGIASFSAKSAFHKTGRTLPGKTGTVHFRFKN
jgi:hypothetical protein